MAIIVDCQRAVGDVAGEIARFESLISGLDHIGASIMPTAAAPLLDPWCLGTCTLPCLIGGNSGHPTLKGRVIRTTDIWALAPGLGWARTLSRFYTLKSYAFLQIQMMCGGEGRPMRPGEWT